VVRSRSNPPRGEPQAPRLRGTDRLRFPEVVRPGLRIPGALPSRDGDTAALEELPREPPGMVPEKGTSSSDAGSLPIPKGYEPRRPDRPDHWLGSLSRVPRPCRDNPAHPRVIVMRVERPAALLAGAPCVSNRPAISGLRPVAGKAATKRLRLRARSRPALAAHQLRWCRAAPSVRGSFS
jgi:hypothetical protein